MPTRKEGWEAALSDYLLRAAVMPFSYGRQDCGLFVAGAIEAMTGLDVIPLLRGRYSGRREAFAAIRALCGDVSGRNLWISGGSGQLCPARRSGAAPPGPASFAGSGGHVRN